MFVSVEGHLLFLPKLIRFAENLLRKLKENSKLTYLLRSFHSFFTDFNELIVASMSFMNCSDPFPAELRALS